MGRAPWCRGARPSSRHAGGRCARRRAGPHRPPARRDEGRSPRHHGARPMGLKLCTLAYVRDGDKTLMLRRPADGAHPQAGKYNGLGGTFEAGESPETCLAREVLEESGLTVEEARLKGFITFP